MNPMLQLKKSLTNLVLHQILLLDGAKKEKLDLSDQTELKEYTMSMTSPSSLVSKNPLKTKKQSVMPESAVNTKKKILIDKSPCYKKNILKVQSSKTLDLVSIGKDEDLVPFWNPYTKEMSRCLWSPIKTDCVDSDLNYSNGYSKNLMLNSWFSTKVMIPKIPLKNSQMIYLQSLQSLLPKITALEQENINEKENLKVKKKEKAQIALQKRNENKLLNESEDERKNRLEKEEIKRKKQEKSILNKIKREEKLKKKAEKEDKEYVSNDDIPDAAKSISIQVYFTHDQKQILNKWFGIRRWIYNKCLSLINENNKITLAELRKKVINEENYKVENTWVLDYHYDLRDEALRDLLKNIKSNKAKEKKFKIRFKSLKEEKTKGTSLSVLSKHWNKNNFYKDIFSPKKMKTNEKEKIPQTLLYTSRLIKSPRKKYFICIPQSLKMCDNQTLDNVNMIFLDPGSRDFMTGYDPQGKIVTWGTYDVGRIARLLHYKNKLQSKKDKDTALRARKRNKYRIAILRLGEKIRNLVTDLHRKLAKWLCENYKYIYLPRLNFHTCKNLNKKSKAKLASWRHCEFLKLLIFKSREYEGCRVLEVNESFTSKTCSVCGYQKNNLGKNKIYDCDDCKSVLDRDINASKNIMLRYFSKRVIVR